MATDKLTKIVEATELIDDCHAQDQDNDVASNDIHFCLSVCIKNLQDNPPKEYLDLANSIIAMSSNKHYNYNNPTIEFEIKQHVDRSYTAEIKTPTKKYPLPDKKSFCFSGPDYNKCLENQCFEKIVLDMFGYDRAILNNHYIGVL